VYQVGINKGMKLLVLYMFVTASRCHG